VTGGAEGIGEAICRRLAEEDVAVAILAHEGARGCRRGHVRSSGTAVHIETIDISGYAAVSPAIAVAWQ
jgi:2-hydroxycyclohexanecarboxyl-CoA dehydrogenase